jgi:predicted metal-dependent phosphoesterase TrpH
MSLVCDFHAHSTASDGTLTPIELVEAAHRCGVNVLALTDHDTLAGLPEALVRAEELGLELLPGIELSVSEADGRRQLHILGLGIDPREPALLERVAGFQEERRRRGRRTVELLNQQGIPLRFEEVDALAGDGSIGRPHIARALVRLEVCKSADEAFARFLRRGRPAYVTREGPDAHTAISLIHAAGGIASLAHPPLSTGVGAPGGLDLFVDRLVNLGLDGLEVYHPRHKAPMRKRLRRLLRRHDLLATGGSDFHGGSEADTSLGGGPPLGQDVYEAIQARLTRGGAVRAGRARR